MRVLHNEARVACQWSDRVSLLPMPWSKARDEFVRILGPGSIEECERALVQSGEWEGRSDGVVVLTVRLLASMARAA